MRMTALHAELRDKHIKDLGGRHPAAHRVMSRMGGRCHREPG